MPPHRLVLCDHIAHSLDILQPPAPPDERLACSVWPAGHVGLEVLLELQDRHAAWAVPVVRNGGMLDPRLAGAPYRYVHSVIGGRLCSCWRFRVCAHPGWRMVQLRLLSEGN